MPPILIPLHVKSCYSLAEGVTPLARLVERAVALGLPAMALTDVDNLYGQVVFHRLARERGLKPITGAELRIPVSTADRLGSTRPSLAPGLSTREPLGRLVILALNLAGYENLCRAITRLRLLGPELTTTSPVFSSTEGLHVLTECPQTLERLLATTPLEPAQASLLLVRPGRPRSRLQELRSHAGKLGVTLVADADILYLDPLDAPLHELKVAIGRNLLVTQVRSEALEHPLVGAATQERHFPGPRESLARFDDALDAVAETERIAAACDLDLSPRKPIFPRLVLASGETAYSRLAKLAFHGLEARRKALTPEHVHRLGRELQTIDRLGFNEYFLVVGDIVAFARSQGIEVVGRGSGAGSLVAYTLGVTNVDPIEHRLYFERFLHEGRTDLPDIDIDLCWIRRDEVIEHVYEAHGRDRVAMISSHVTFQPHLAFREAIKAHGVPPEAVNAYSRRIPYTHPESSSSTPIRELILSSPHAASIPLDEEPLRTAVPLAERLLDLPHHISVHPGGIVIADRPIDAYVPLELAPKGIVVTQYDMHSVEDIGLVKIDLLGNRCLTELQETLDAVRRRNEGREHPTPAGASDVLELGQIPDGDPETLRLIAEGRTLGCFQLESPAMRSLLRKLRPRAIGDLIAAVAIIRPGAAAGGAKEAFIRRRRDEETASYLHPSLRRILGDTLGIIVYEEDVMCIASAIAGLSLAEGDALRSAIKKRQHADDVRELENEFIRRSVQNGIAPDIALAVWKDLRKFAAYCFSKAHAAGYGVLAYQAAYLKVRFPSEFACALLNHHAGMYSTRTIAEEVKRMGVPLLPPSINRSARCFTLEHPAVRIGLGRVKQLSASALEALLADREQGGPFASFTDFLRRVRILRREVEALILAGAFDDLPPPPGLVAPLHQPQLLWELETTARSGATAGSIAELHLPGEAPRHPDLEPYDALTRLQNELSVLDLTVLEHPMQGLRKEAAARGCVATIEAEGRRGGRARVAGIVAAGRTIRTQKGERMQFLTIEDEQGLLEATLFPAVWRRVAGRIRSLGPYIFEGRVEDDHDALSLTVERILPWKKGSRP